MANTYTALHYHVVFSTKNREPLIHPEWRDRLHDYIGGALRGLEAYPHGVGGTQDHVHLLFGMNPTQWLADVMRETKKNSSAWVRDEMGESGFAWQDGYAGFTVSAPGLEAVRHYIMTQEEHHQQRSFREELVMMLEKAGVAYNPSFLE
ncbi:MAG: IS200/IS605 family transposase [Candidatus Hydrogenedentota bacterium]